MEYRQQAEMEDCRLIATAKKEAKKSVLKSYFEALLRNGLFEQFEDSPHTIQFIKASQEALANMNDPMLKEFKCIWITLTPEECHDYDNNPKRLAEEIIKWLEKSSHVSTYSFAIEQRSDNIELMGKGVHAHILIQQTDLTYTRWVEWVKRTWGCKHGVKFNFFGRNKTGAIYFKDEEFAKEKEQYLLGNKEGSHKQALSKIDKLFREKYNIQPIYKSKE
jgi:hypothetical protein